MPYADIDYPYLKQPLPGYFKHARSQKQKRKVERKYKGPESKGNREEKEKKERKKKENGKEKREA